MTQWEGESKMKPIQALKSRIREESKDAEVQKEPSLLDVLRERNRGLEVREHRRALLRRIGRR